MGVAEAMEPSAAGAVLPGDSVWVERDPILDDAWGWGLEVLVVLLSTGRRR